MADWRYVAEVTINRNIFFISHPDSRNSIAIQSSNSGCDGASPCEPKSPAVLTIPLPKTSCQKRFTATREVRGFDASTIHFASPRRFLGSDESIGGNTG